MSVFNVGKPIVNEHQQRADGILAFGNQVADELVRLYRMSGEMMWKVPDYKIADAQAVIDAMEANAIPAFTLHAALGQFISQTYPGALDPSELSSPVSYQIMDGKIVLDTNAKYPTEPQESESVT